MLILSRKTGQSVHIQPQSAAVLGLSLGEVFAEGPVRVVVTRLSGGQVRLGFAAHSALAVVREEFGISYE